MTFTSHSIPKEDIFKGDDRGDVANSNYKSAAINPLK